MPNQYFLISFNINFCCTWKQKLLVCKWLILYNVCTVIFVPKAHNHKFNPISIHYWLQSINKINLLLDAKHDEKELAFEGKKRGENIFLLYNNWNHIEDKVYWLLEIIASWYLILPFEAMGFKDQIASFDKSFLFKYKQKKKHFPITFMYIFSFLKGFDVAWKHIIYSIKHEMSGWMIYKL